MSTRNTGQVNFCWPDCCCAIIFLVRDMKVIILREALNELLLRSFSGSQVQGYLLGKRTGQGLFVERILVLSWRQLLNSEFFFQVEKNQGKEILGVFSLNSKSRELKKVLNPLFYEKIFLNLATKTGQELRPEVYLVNFDHRFFFEPLGQIIMEMEVADD